MSELNEQADGQYSVPSADVIEAIANAYDVERATVDAAMEKAIAGDTDAMLCMGVNLDPEQLPADSNARRFAIECAISQELNAK